MRLNNLAEGNMLTDSCGALTSTSTPYLGCLFVCLELLPCKSPLSPLVNVILLALIQLSGRLNIWWFCTTPALGGGVHTAVFVSMAVPGPLRPISVPSLRVPAVIPGGPSGALWRSGTLPS